MTSTAPLAALADFSDRLSPMVVKELRQGLRTRTFRGVLLLLHLLLILITLVTGAARNPDEVKWMLDTLGILALCVALPLSGFSALAGEMKSKTLETLVLTRLSAPRIVFGKWASIASQALLVALSLMPYYVARYAFGGSDVVAELSRLGGMWLAGITLAAGVVCLSTQQAFWVRAVVVALFFFGPSIFAMMLVVSGATHGRVTASPASVIWTLGAMPSGWGMAVLMILGAAWLIFFFLSLAATRIAPAASNLALTKRLVHVVVLAGLVLTAWWRSSEAQIYLTLAAYVTSLASLDALIEWRTEVPSPLIPYYRRGLAGRLAGWFLAPGWPNGMFYSLGMAAAAGGAAWSLGEGVIGVSSWLEMASLWLCMLILHVSIGRRARDLLAPYLGLAFFVGLISSLVLLITSVVAAKGGGVVWGLILPGTALATLRQAVGDPAAAMKMTITALGISVVWPLLLTALAVLDLRRTRGVRAEARRLAVEQPS